MVTTKIATSTQKPEVPKTPWVKSLMFTYFFLAWGSSLSENGSIQPYRQTEDSELKYETVFSRVNIAATFDHESLFFFLNIPPIRAWLKIISYHATNRRCIIIQLRSLFFINELKKKIFNAVARERKSQSFIKKIVFKDLLSIINRFKQCLAQSNKNLSTMELSNGIFNGSELCRENSSQNREPRRALFIIKWQ